MHPQVHVHAHQNDLPTRIQRKRNVQPHVVMAEDEIHTTHVLLILHPGKCTHRDRGTPWWWRDRRTARAHQPSPRGRTDRAHAAAPACVTAAPSHSAHAAAPTEPAPPTAPSGDPTIPTPGDTIAPHPPCSPYSAHALTLPLQNTQPHLRPPPQTHPSSRRCILDVEQERAPHPHGPPTRAVHHTVRVCVCMCVGPCVYAQMSRYAHES